MPRELIHWTVFEKCREELKNAPKVSDLINANLEASLVGVMAHDAPYYYKFGGSEFEIVASHLHGKEGNDTFEPLRMLAEKIILEPSNDQDFLWAFLFGMLSHYATDIVMHPMIFYYTGNYHSKDLEERSRARARHRLFEVYLDSWAKHTSTLSHSIYFTKLYNSLGEKLNCIGNFLDRFLNQEYCTQGKETSVPNWMSSFKYMAFFQKAFLSNSFGLFFRCLNKVSFSKFDGIDALFTYSREHVLDLLRSDLEYQNPHTGESFSKSLDELISLSISQNVKILTLFEPIVSGESISIKEQLASIEGPSLNSGVLGSKGIDLKHFCTSTSLCSVWEY